MKTIAFGTFALGLAAAAPASAQTMIVWPAPVAAAQAASTSYFPIGTPLRLVTRTEVSSKENKPGDRLYLTVAEDLTYRGQVIVPAGSVAVGEVADMQRNGHFGKKGKLGIQLLHVETPSGPIRLSGRAGDEGTSATAVSIATIALVSWTGMFIHGTSAYLPSGTPVAGYLAQDLRFAARPVQPDVALNFATPDAAPPRVAAVQTAVR